MSPNRQGRFTAVLGPTNTGKTYLAIERMLGHRTGMIGFPLRLLARENYERVVAAKGRGRVALVTGEEKIVPPSPAYFLCTVESMPIDRPIDFLAIDEIQLCADTERGHVFTDRLLHARGEQETMLLGSDTIRPLLKKLVPEADYIARPRFSKLSYAGPKKVTRLPARSAVVAFSAADVYAIAELIRQQRGGTAVVLGALSPRTRNAQVALFEEGEVDYLVATDAIGMGLNLNLDHVAFAKLGKFDGRLPRPLSAAEVAQIAGRAGRHMSDGTFGVTAEQRPMEAGLVEAVESHRFDPLHALFWRSHRLDFRSPRLLLKALERRPPVPELIRVRNADDQLALAALARDPEIERLARHPAAVRLLWEVCQVPDFRKILSDQHVRLLGRMYRYLMEGEGRLCEDWVARHLAHVDRTDGDIEALTARIAHVRTWTYVAHRGDWLADSTHWQERARGIEDRLSDALHDRLTQRFVDRRAAFLVRRLKGGDRLMAAVRKNGEVLVEGEFVGHLNGFSFVRDQQARGEHARPLMAATRRALSDEIPRRLLELEADPDGVFSLDAGGRIDWRNSAIARLTGGDTPLSPRVEPLSSDFLDGAQRERVRRRLALWLGQHLKDRLSRLFRLADADLPGPARGLAFQLVEALGTLPRITVAAQIRSLSRTDRRTLQDLGVRFGRESVWLSSLSKPATVRLRGLLWAVHAGEPLPRLPSPGILCFDPKGAASEACCLALGYRYFANGAGAIALRVDALERLSREARKLSAQGDFAMMPSLMRLSGCGETELMIALSALGYLVGRDDMGVVFAPRTSGRGTRTSATSQRRRKPGHNRRYGDSPFAILRRLKHVR